MGLGDNELGDNGVGDNGVGDRPLGDNDTESLAKVSKEINSISYLNFLSCSTIF